MTDADAIILAIGAVCYFAITLSACLVLMMHERKRAKAELAAVEYEWGDKFRVVEDHFAAIRLAMNLQTAAIVNLGGTVPSAQETTGKWTLHEEEDKDDE